MAQLTVPPKSERALKRQASLGAIFLTIFLDLLGFGLVLPFLGEEARDSFGSSEFIGSLLGSVYSLMQFVFVPVWGALSDRVGRRPVLLWSVAASAIGMTALGLALVYGHHVGWLFAARIWSGIATANIGTASAYIADVTPPEERARGMGLIGMAFGLGFILGPGVGGMLADISVGGRHGPVPCFVAGALGIVNLGWVYLGLGESLPGKRVGTSSSAPPRRRSLAPLNVPGMRATFATTGLALAVLVNFVATLAFTNFDQTFRFFNKDMFAMSRKDSGFLLAFIGVTAALVQGALIRPLSKRFAEVFLVRAGLLLEGIAFAGIAFSAARGYWLLYAASAALALGSGLVQPSLSAFVSKRASAHAQGETLGTYQSFSSLARTFGPAMGGYLYGTFGPRAPYVVCAGGMLLAAWLAFGLVSQRKASTQMS